MNGLILILVGVLVVGIAVLALTNNVFLVIALGFLLFGAYWFIEYRKLASSPMPPYTLLRTRILNAISQCNPRTLGYLILRGDSDFQRITLGKIVGIIEWSLDPKVDDLSGKKEYDFPKEWKKIIIIGYTSKTGWIYNLPFFSSLRKVELFAVARHQLWDVPSMGDIRIKGTSIEPVYLFWMVNSVDLDKDYIGHALKSEVHRITLEQYFDKLPKMIDNAVNSDGFQLKVKELMNDKQKPKSGIIT